MTSSLTTEQTRALTSIALFAAFSDGIKSSEEREKVRELGESIGDATVAESIRRVLLKQTTLAAEAAALDTPELRHLAWEGALAVCETDGATSPAEREFLRDLAKKLGRPAEESDADVALVDFAAQGAVSDRSTGALALPAVAPPPVVNVDPRGAQVDQSVLRYAILTAGLELLPQSLATVAIIPLQTKMVHGVGSAYGISLSAASIKELVAAVGIGSAGQMVESYARGILGKLAGSVLGKAGKTAVRWGTGPVLTFATTYAMGMVAKQYYAGGRTLAAVDLRSLFAAQLEQGKALYSKYEPQVRDAAATANPRQLLATLGRGA
jgi:uncharacterized protein (DUF697 family)/tellurite resistance protein